MKKLRKITESDINRIISLVISESEYDDDYYKDMLKRGYGGEITKPSREEYTDVKNGIMKRIRMLTLALDSIESVDNFNDWRRLSGVEDKLFECIKEIYSISNK